MLSKRGALIVIEGVDRTGKTTQCKLLVENLKKMSIEAEYMNFPDRSTEIGKVIDGYLKSKNNLSDEAIHLLFSANRWEKNNLIKKLLDQGISIIMDRYCYSGVVFSAAKDITFLLEFLYIFMDIEKSKKKCDRLICYLGLDVNWCKSSDVGLPQPDKVFFLNMPIENAKQRNGFGNERYEQTDFQSKVMDLYMQLKECDNWDVINANRSKEIVQDNLLHNTLRVMNNVGNKPLGRIWSDTE